jgi:DDE superfamily endonuclease
MRDVDEVIRQVRAQLPSVESRQLQVKHPGVDDDGLWFFRLADTGITVQSESTVGACPFLIETDAHDRRQHGTDVFHFLPPNSPETNVIEQLWKQLHDHVTRNHTHRTIEPLMEAVDEFIEDAQPFP